MFTTLRQNVKYSLRTLVKSAGFTITAVFTLALGISATTAIFSVVYTTLFEPLPYPKPDQLVVLWSKPQGAPRNEVSPADFYEWRKRTKSFQALEAWTGGTCNISTSDHPQQVPGSIMTPGFHSLTGSRILLGRDFLPEEGQLGKDQVVILSHRLWTQHFGADPELIGKQVRINSKPYTVVGITPPGFQDRLPFQLWVPLALPPEAISHDFHWMSVMGRLKDGVSIAQAQAEMDGISQQLAQEFPRTNTNWGVSVEPLHLDWFPKEKQRNLWLLLGAVTFLLLIGCVNVANLMLARATTRRREVALRAALGASRAHIFIQLLTESLVVSVTGGVLGSLLAAWMTRGIVLAMPEGLLPSEADIRISLPVLFFTLLLTLLTGLLFGTAPAWQSSRQDLVEILKLGGRTGGNGAQSQARRVLVIAEFALALTLLAAGGLWLRSFWNLTNVDVGFDKNNVLAFDVPVEEGKLQNEGQVRAYYDQILESVRKLPNVDKVAVSTAIPLKRGTFTRKFRIVGRPPVDSADSQRASYVQVSADYHETLGVKVSRGRDFDEHDNATSQRVIMVNETFAKRYLAGLDPIGQRIVLEQFTFEGKPDGELEWQIVGVFHDVRFTDLRATYDPEIDVPFSQSSFPYTSIAVRTKGDPRAVIKDIAGAVTSVDPDLPIAGVKTMEELRGESLAIDRLGMLLFAAFAVLGLILSVIGIYGVMAFVVTQRTHEFGIRIALGAQRARVIKLVVREGLILAGVGSIIGLSGAYLVGRALQSTLYGVEALDLRAFTAVALVLLLSALLACLVPALRASRVDPIEALRAE